MATRPEDPSVSTYSTDEAAVRYLYRELMEGWNRGNGEGFAAVFTEDGDLVAYGSTHFAGRDELLLFPQELFDSWMKGTRLPGPGPSDEVL